MSQQRDPDALYRSITNESGFPLQIRVMNCIEQSKDDHGWQVVCYEHSWKNENDGSDGFIDIVIRNKYNTSTILIECKRVQEYPWVFLVTDESDTKRRKVKAWLTTKGRAFDDKFEWVQLSVDPRSPLTSFCAVKGQDKNNPILEKYAANLVSATEAFAFEDKMSVANNSSLHVYFSAIVTNAPIIVGHLAPEKISMNDGKISDLSFTERPYLRFHKQLSKADYSSIQLHSQPASIRAALKERTVFVINANHLSNFLKDFEIDSNSLNSHLGSYRI